MADNILGLLFEINADPSRAEAAMNSLQGSVSQSVRKQATEFDNLAQVAGAAFNQMAGNARGAGGVIQQVFGQIADSIRHQIDLQQLSVAETSKGEAAKSAAAIKGIKDVAIVRAIEETAEGISALASFQFHEAALHFLSAAKFGAIAAVQLAPAFDAAGGGSVQGPRQASGAQGSSAAGGSAVLAPGAASASGQPGGNVTVMVMGEPQAAAWMTRVINQGVLQNDQMLVASHTKRSAPAGR